jgi:hypothetical protein
MKKLLGITVFSVLGLFIAAGTALAVQIDFTSDLYAPAQGQKTFARDGLLLSAMPAGEDVYFTWTADDGIGIGGNFGYEDDEVEFDEWMRIDFENSVRLTDVYLTDFFVETRGEHTYQEHGQILFLYADGSLSPVFDFWQTDAGSVNGAYTLDVAGWTGDREVAAVGLSGVGANSVVGEDHEFAVAGLEVSPVPEPASIFLLGSGMLGLAAWRRKAAK